MVTFKNNVKTAVLLGALFGLLVWVGSYWGTGGMIAFGIMAVFMNFGAWFFSDKIAVAAMRGREVGPKPRSTDFLIWWDGDPLRELLTYSGVSKWNWETGVEERLFPTQASRRHRPKKAPGPRLTHPTYSLVDPSFQ